MVKPLPVTVCIPCRNRRFEMEVALPHILAQNPAEVIIIDDGSTDGSGEWLAQQPVKVITKPDQGYRQNPADTSNIAARLATESVLIHQSAEVAPLAGCYAKLLEAVISSRPAFARVLDAPMSYVESLQVGKPLAPSMLYGQEWIDEEPFDHEHQIGAPFTVYTGFERRRPLFFCGAIFAAQWWALGGYDERPEVQGDLAFANALRDAGIKSRGLGDAIALHIQHGRS